MERKMEDSFIWLVRNLIDGKWLVHVFHLEHTKIYPPKMRWKICCRSKNILLLLLRY